MWTFDINQLVFIKSNNVPFVNNKVLAYFLALSTKFTSCKQIHDATGWRNDGVYTLWNKALTQRYNVSIIYPSAYLSACLALSLPTYLSMIYLSSINQPDD